VSNHYKRRLDRDRLEALLGAAGVPPGQMRGCTELTDGTFNTAYAVRLVDGTGLVVKISPDPAAPILRYEQRIMRAEALFYRLAGRRGAPVPEVVHAGFDQRLIDGDFLVMSQCPGTPWHGRTEPPRGARRYRLRHDLGRVVAGLHQITGDGFGYPEQTVAPLDPSWRWAFLAMVGAVLQDARRFGVRLPRPIAEVGDLFEAHADLLDEVDTPVLVHFDLWDGNILLDMSAGRPRIGGLIDGERAFWGDPVADLVSLALFGDIEADEAFLRGYRSAGGRVSFDPPTRRRLRLYRTYLHLIMLVEVVPRGYDDTRRRWLDRHVGPLLVADL
jgi:aminoglycoside phosphotransferase (APT) family kinase protein